jgi:hypothetical protein
LSFILGYPYIKQQIKYTQQELKQQSLAGTQLQPPTIPIPNTLFSMHVLNLQYGAVWPTVPFGSWRSWDAAGTWAYMEKQKGSWDFQLLDKYIALAKQSNAEVLLVLGLTPKWASARPDEDSAYKKGTAAEPKQIADWRNYVRQVATRYKGQVRYYEIWNEPNSKRFYSGSIKQLVALSREAYQTLKSIDPAIQVVSPAMSPCCESFKYLDEYFAEGGGKYADIIGYHFYVAPAKPETMLFSINQVKTLMAKHGLAGKSLWNTETGWRIQNRDRNLDDEEWAGQPLPDADASAYVARAYLISWAAGVKRLYWYAWGHRSMGFTDYDGKTPKPVAGSFNEIQKWLVGATLTSCKFDDKDIWVCELERNQNRISRIIWSTNGNIPFVIPDSWNVKQSKTLDGKTYKPPFLEIQLNSSPILLEG